MRDGYKFDIDARFDSRVGQIGRNVANASLPLRRFIGAAQLFQPLSRGGEPCHKLRANTFRHDTAEHNKD